MTYGSVAGCTSFDQNVEEDPLGIDEMLANVKVLSLFSICMSLFLRRANGGGLGICRCAHGLI